MTSRLIVFFLLTAWGYLALLLLQRNGLASLGRAAQSVSLALLCAAVLVFWAPVSEAAARVGRGLGMDPDAFGETAPVAVLAILFAATGILPPALRRRALRRAAAGRSREALKLERWAAFLSWQRPPRSETVLRRANAWAATGRFASACDILAEAMDDMRPSAEWARIAAERVEFHSALREWHEVLALAEEIRRLVPTHLGPRTLYAASRAHLETGDHRAGLRALQEAEAQRERTGKRAETGRFMAFVSALALTGREDLLRGLFEDPAAPTVLLPRMAEPYWLAVARSAAGDPEGARPLFQAALASSDRDNAGWREVVEQRMRAAESLAPVPEDVRSEAGRLAALWRSKPPVHPLTYGHGRAGATLALIALNTGAWVAVALWPTNALHDTLVRFGANVPQWVARGQLWRLASGVFLHGGPLHLFLNMYALFMLGGFVERTLGHSSALLVFVLGGLFASSCTAFLSPYPVSVGSSGAVLALLGAAFAVVIRRRGLFPARARSMYLMNYGYLAATSAAVGWFVPDVDNFAHLGGLAAGLALGLVLVPRGKRTPAHRLLQRAAAIGSSLLLGFWLWQAGADALAGGYPHTARLVRREVPELGVSVEIPRLWRRRGAGVPVAYVQAITGRNRYAMHQAMFKYFDLMQIAPADDLPAPKPAPTPDEDALPPDEAFDGPVETVFRVVREGREFNLSFVAGSRSAAEARRELYRRIAESLRVEEDGAEVGDGADEGQESKANEP